MSIHHSERHSEEEDQAEHIHASEVGCDIMLVGRYAVFRVRHRVMVVLSCPAFIYEEGLDKEESMPNRHPPEEAVVKSDRGVVE